jgi:hypothetical protein
MACGMVWSLLHDMKHLAVTELKTKGPIMDMCMCLDMGLSSKYKARYVNMIFQDGKSKLP